MYQKRAAADISINKAKKKSNSDKISAMNDECSRF